MTIIKSKRFILRPYRKEDEKSLVENINNKEVLRFMSRLNYPYTMRDAKKWMKEFKKSNKNKTAYSFAIDVGSCVIGGIGLMSIEKHKAEIGYWIGKKFWNKGIVSEAVRLVTNFGFKKLKLRRIYATIFINNKASARVLGKNGYKLEGLLKKYYLKDGKFSDAKLYAKTK